MTKKRKRQSKQYNQIRLQNMFLNQNLKRIHDLEVQKEKLEEVVSMLSVLAEAVLFDWDNVAEIAREAAKIVADIKNP